MIAGSDNGAERAAEDALRAAGVRDARVRAHGEVARIELTAAELERLLGAGEREAVVAAVRACGFRFVSLDLGALDGE